ncbi:14059_t:CDS:2 [Entrophospora sp. SA101]|nr:14059_t:CDS:2 [Entrophospora sp. SA101]CAJ0919515.1 20577_t:CDS:2 [Entrophospora sp. SA101]CAJ0919518.1 20579_t:CDS:2 [Entrophospora sp. SA101]
MINVFGDVLVEAKKSKKNDGYIDIEKFTPSNLDDAGDGIGAYKKRVDKLLDNKEKSDSLNLQVKSKGRSKLRN